MGEGHLLLWVGGEMKLDKVPSSLAVKDCSQEPVVREGDDSHTLPSTHFRSWLILGVSGAVGGAPNPICISALIAIHQSCHQ